MAVNTFKKGNSHMNVDTSLNVNLGINVEHSYQPLKSPLDMSANGSRESLVGSEKTMDASSPSKAFPLPSLLDQTFDIVP